MHIGREIWTTLATFVALSASLASVPAGERPAVVELFTSQGCSSCPPADALMAQLSKDREDVIVLSFPVDIWDYNGWKDTLARPEFSTRQKHYSQSRGDHQVYTPQVIVDGQAHGVGSDRGQLIALMQETTSLRQAQSVPLYLQEHDGLLRVELGEGSSDLGRGAGVWLLRVAKSLTVTVGRGENKGRQITYTNVVRSTVRIGFWTGVAARFEVPLPEGRADDADGYVVIVQKSWGDTLGPILAASKGGAL